MKNALILAALLLASTSRAGSHPSDATESASKSFVSNPEDAIAESIRISGLEKVLEKSGYAALSTTTEQVYYFAVPRGDYEWGTILYAYQRTSPATGRTESATLAFTLRASPEIGYYVSCTALTACQ